jgi:hypothetical protein
MKRSTHGGAGWRGLLFAVALGCVALALTLFKPWGERPDSQGPQLRQTEAGERSPMVRSAIQDDTTSAHLGEFVSRSECRQACSCARRRSFDPIGQLGLMGSVTDCLSLKKTPVTKIGGGGKPLEPKTRQSRHDELTRCFLPLPLYLQ